MPSILYVASQAQQDNLVMHIIHRIDEEYNGRVGNKTEPRPSLPYALDDLCGVVLAGPQTSRNYNPEMPFSSHEEYFEFLKAVKEGGLDVAAVLGKKQTLPGKNKGVEVIPYNDISSVVERLGSFFGLGSVSCSVLNSLNYVGDPNKILVVDDEEHIRYLYSEELKEEGYKVVTEDSGFRLLERISEEKPGLVLLDVKLGDYNGLDLLQDIRNKYYNLPVILVTAYDDFKDDMKSIAADFYVIKSFDLTELKHKIRKALEIWNDT